MRLCGTSAEPGTAPRPSVADLVQQFQALKAAQTVEVMPERVGTRQSAEEAVTARIRRRLEQVLAPDASSERGGDPAVGQRREAVADA